MALNDKVEKDEYTLPNIERIIESTQNSKWFTVIDLKEAFYHIKIKEEHRHKTAFEYRRQKYEWTGMVMGFKNSPTIIQRIMDLIFKI